MTSVKCPQCGLVYWSTSENCRRCGPPEEVATPEPEVQAQPAPATQMSDAAADGMLITLKKCSSLFYFIGGLQIVAWFFLGNLLVIDGIFNLGLSYLAFKFKSRVAACLLLLLTLLSLMINALAMVMGAKSFNLFVPLVLMWRLATSARMVYLTFKLNAHEEVDVTRMMPPLPPVFQKEDTVQWTQPRVSSQLQAE